MGLQMITKR